MPSPLIILAVNIALAQTTPDVIVTTTAGAKPAAPLLSIDNEFALKLGGKPPFVVPAGELVALRRAEGPLPAPCPPPFLQLTTGDRLPLAALLDVNLADETLNAKLAAPLNGKITLPQAALAVIALTAAHAKFDSPKGDLVALRNGDRLEGKLVSFDATDGARLTIGDETVTIAVDRIALIAFNPEFQARPRWKNPYADVTLKGGGRVSMSKLATVGPAGELAGTTLFGNRLSFAADQLVALRIRQGRAVYLDELKPAKYEATPFLDVAWPLAVGRTLQGGPLTIAGDVYPLGVATHSKSRVTYALDGEFAWFETLVAIDPTAGPRAAAKVDVELDGKPVSKTATLLKAGDAAKALRIDVSGAKTLTLITDFGPRGDVQGHVIWADARLIRAGK